MHTTPLLLTEVNRGSCAIQLLLTQGAMRVLAEEPSRMEAEILMRATKMSEVLEEILRHAHREPHWGLNE